MMREYKSYVLSIFSLQLLSGCNFGVDLNKPSDNIKDGLTNLSEGIKNIDPLALKQMFDQNEQLREKLQKVIGSMSPIVASSAGYIVLSRSKIKLHIASYTGEFVLNAWNGRTQVATLKSYPMISQGVPDLISQYKYDLYHIKINNPSLCYGVVDPQKYAEWIYNRVPCRTDKPAVEDVVLNYTFGDDGAKNIRLEFTPLHADSGGVWSMDGQIRAESANGESDVIEEFGVSQDQAPLNKPYVISLNIYVRSDQTGK